MGKQGCDIWATWVCACAIFCVASHERSSQTRRARRSGACPPCWRRSRTTGREAGGYTTWGAKWGVTYGAAMVMSVFIYLHLRRDQVGDRHVRTRKALGVGWGAGWGWIGEREGERRGVGGLRGGCVGGGAWGLEFGDRPWCLRHGNGCD